MSPETDMPLPKAVFFQEVSVAETARQMRAITPFY
jgi:hypothetical protein